MDHSCLEANMLNNCGTNLEDIEKFIYNNFSNQMESSEFLFFFDINSTDIYNIENR